MATQVANAAGEEVDSTMHSIRQGDRFIDKIPGTRSGTVNLDQFSMNQQRGKSRLHNRGGSGSSGSGGQRIAGRPVSPQLQLHGFNGRSNTSREFPSFVSSLPADLGIDSAPMGTPRGMGSQSHRSQIPVMGGTRQNAFNVETGPPYRASPIMRQPLASNLIPRDRNFGLGSGAPKRTGMGNIGHLGR